MINLVNYSRFGAICELESAQAVAPQKLRCGTTVCVKRKSICIYVDVRKSAHSKQIQICAYPYNLYNGEN